MTRTGSALTAEDIFDFSIIDELRDDIQAINIRHGGKPYFYREGYLTYSDYNIRHGGHGKRIVESLNRMFSKVSGGVRYLDIGCVDVPVLAFMAKHFDEVMLIEPNPYSREIASLIIKAQGMNRVTVVPSITEVQGQFDSITAWECLEHVVSADASVSAAQYANYWQAKREFLDVIKGHMTKQSHLFWSVPVMTGWVFAAKYVASLMRGRPYSAIDMQDALLHLTGQTRRIDKWISVGSHLGFNEKQFVKLVKELFAIADIEKLPGRKGINEHLYGHCRISG